MNKTLANKLKPLLAYAALPLLLAVLLLLLADTTSMPYREVHGENGVWDLRDFDFENYNALLVGEMAYIPNELLTPGDFAALSDSIVLGSIGNVVDVNFLTSRDIILLPDDDAWFTFFRRSTTYAQRQYVNGVWLSNTGRSNPGRNRNTNISDTGLLIFTAQPQDGQIELVQQSSNFVHRQGNRHFAWQVSASTGLIYQSRAIDYRQGIIMGSYFLLFMVFMLLFFMLRKNRAALYFALFCLMWFVRTGMTETRAFTVLYPWIDWTAKIRLEYISSPVAAILTLAIIDVLFPKTLNKTIVWVYYAVSAALVVVYMFIDTVIMTQIGFAMYIIFGLCVVYMLLMFALKVRNVSAEQKIFIAGMGLFLFSTVSDMVLFSLYNFGISIVPFQITGMAFLMFALCMATAVFIATMKEVEAAKEAERRLAAENAMLEILSQSRGEFLQNMSHEMKTPLTVIASGIDFADMQIKENNVIVAEDVLASIREETQRLGRIVSGMLSLSALSGSGENRRRVNFSALLKTCAETFMVMLEEQNNELKTTIAQGMPDVFIESDLFIQVISNLFTNASQHTKNGQVSLSASFDARYISVCVSDSGTGVAPEILPKIFERGTSGSGSTGFGLFISKAIVEAHGGTITVESETGKGTQVSFTVPVYSGQEAGHRHE